MSKDKTKLACICGKIFYRKVIDGQVYTCSRECRRKLLSEIGYQCSICRNRFPEENFRWFDDSRYHNGKRRFPYCLDCEKEKIQSYRDTHPDEMRKQHNKWRERCLSAGGDTS